MRITTLDLKIGQDVGLRPGRMTPLDDLVVLAGPNGAGKSRLLALVNEILANGALAEGSADGLRSILHQDAHHLSRTGKHQYAPRQLAAWTKSLAQAEAVTLDGAFQPNSVVDFLPKHHDLRDHRFLTEAEQTEAEKSAIELGVNDIEQHALAYISRILRRWFASTHPKSEVSEEAKAHACAERDRLCELVQDLLGAQLTLDLNQQPTIFERPLSEARLSHGQGLLLQLAVMLHGQGARLDGLVLLLDEPECHLHPAAVIDAIKRLRALNRVGQIWIATHCVPLLAAVPPESIWYVNDGGASWAGRRPEVVLEGLLGGPDGRELVEDFLRLPAQFASNRFAAECLVAPKSVLTGADDPQARQIRDFCHFQSKRAERPLRVLDFGAGQGRLFSALREGWPEDSLFCEAVDFRAFEPFEDTSRLEQLSQEVYPTGGPIRVFSKRHDLAKIDPNSLDVVVLCNVLHEIPPEEWAHLLGTDGTITSLLRTDGYLLILEDMSLPHGEKAHRFGFLLLDHSHLYKLFECTEQDAPIETVHAYAGRLTAHVVPASLLGRTTRDSTRAALKLLRQTARHEITRLRQDSLDSRSGRLHSMWTQLLANTDLGLEVL